MCVYLQKCRIRSLINSLMLLNSLLDRLPHTTKARGHLREETARIAFILSYGYPECMKRE